MLNILQHYQKYHKMPCFVNNTPTSPTQLCKQNSDNSSKYRSGSNCVKSYPGQLGFPTISEQKKYRNQQYKNNDQWIGVL